MAPSSFIDWEFVKMKMKLFLLLVTCFFTHLQGSTPKIALLFLTRSDLNHPDLWKTLLDEAPDRYTLYIHSKESMTHPFFKDFRISTIVPTTWLNHVKAWQLLIKML